MNANRANLDDSPNNSVYIVLSIVFFLLSLVGLFFIFQINSQKSVIPQTPVITPVPEPTISPEVSPILTPAEIIPSPAVSITPIATFSASISAIPTKKISPTSTPTPKITITPKPTATASGTLTFKSPVDNFSVDYLSYRKVYQDKENGGNRYTFYSTKGSFAVHVGSDWSWVYSERSFSNVFTINNLPTSRYDTDSQTLVDIENQAKKYTIQCIHNGISSLKTECENFIQSFKFL